MVMSLQVVLDNLLMKCLFHGHGGNVRKLIPSSVPYFSNIFLVAELIKYCC